MSEIYYYPKPSVPNKRITCKGCGKSVIIHNSSLYCSEECKKKHFLKDVILVCKSCGKEIKEFYFDDILQKSLPYCNKNCFLSRYGKEKADQLYNFKGYPMNRYYQNDLRRKYEK